MNLEDLNFARTSGAFPQLIDEGWNHAPDIDFSMVGKKLHKIHIGYQACRSQGTVQTEKRRHQDIHDDSGTLQGSSNVVVISSKPAGRYLMDFYVRDS